MASLFSHLKDQDLRQAFAALHAIAESNGDRPKFINAALDQLASLAHSDLTTLSVCDLQAGTRKVYGRQSEALSPDDRAAFDHHFRAHPLVRFHGANRLGPTKRISDCMTDQAFRHSALFSDYYRRIGIRSVMALPLRIDEGNLISIVFNRTGTDFVDAERDVLEAIRPQLVSLYRSVLAREEAEAGLAHMMNLAESGGWLVVRVNIKGKIFDANPSVHELLRRFFPNQKSVQPSILPAPLVDWLSRGRNWGLDRSAAFHGQAYEMARFNRKLVIHWFVDSTNSERGILLMRETQKSVRTEDLSDLPLTKREREILALVAAGKTNPDIAMIFDLSPRTVQKHLEHVFQKLGVETRTAAAVRAMSVAEQPR